MHHCALRNLRTSSFAKGTTSFLGPSGSEAEVSEETFEVGGFLKISPIGFLASFAKAKQWNSSSGTNGVAERGRGGGTHGVRGASGGVLALKPGLSPDLSPLARPVLFFQ